MTAEAVNYRWIMEVTFVVTVLVGVPLIAVASAFITLDDWATRVRFATTLAAIVWIGTAAGAYLVARRRAHAASKA